MIDYSTISLKEFIDIIDNDNHIKKKDFKQLISNKILRYYCFINKDNNICEIRLLSGIIKTLIVEDEE